jgi:methyl-accepting chemotaxis protein-1 (serine sensor receptor)
MEDIAAGSRRIGSIIGVIDGIAFQTNLLALNAAVEAARAGEQGRGFAVVAAEVRMLAQRSAEAAKEVKQLIDASMGKVAQGVEQVQDAGATMGQLVHEVKSVAALIREISTASRAQTQGIGEVTVSVSELDLATQQNASLVEEMAGASGSLRDQANRLMDAVALFRTARNPMA